MLQTPASGPIRSLGAPAPFRLTASSSPPRPAPQAPGPPPSPPFGPASGGGDSAAPAPRSSGAREGRRGECLRGANTAAFVCGLCLPQGRPSQGASTGLLAGPGLAFAWPLRAADPYPASPSLWPGAAGVGGVLGHSATCPHPAAVAGGAWVVSPVCGGPGCEWGSRQICHCVGDFEQLNQLAGARRLAVTCTLQRETS